MNGFIGEIRMFGGNFAPRAWAFCDGQLLSIAQNTALFSILGTTYGGDGRTTFALPDMRGRTALSSGTGPGLPTYRLGQRSGQEMVHLNNLQIPSHNHLLNITAAKLKVTDATGDSDEAVGHVLATGTDNANNAQRAYANVAGTENLGGVTLSGTVGLTGGSQYHNNMQPYEVVNYIICLQGTFPSRS